MQKLIELVQKNESVLVKRALLYSKLYGYTKYASTLEEAWIASISGLTKALTDAVIKDPNIPELRCEQDFRSEPMTAFFLAEAKKHRGRGVGLELFLSFMKYYRQAYLDLIEESVSDFQKLRIYWRWINRFFDINELACICEWTGKSDSEVLSELQKTNLALTNEKNKYLTIFESAPNPTVIVDSQDRCVNINHAAFRLINAAPHTPGSVYYANLLQYQTVEQVLPWISEDYRAFCQRSDEQGSAEKEFDSPTKGKRMLAVKFQKMLDVSGKFEGTEIIFEDLTNYKNIESKLRRLSFYDQLTGLYNRTYMEQELMRIDIDCANPIGFFSIDIDGMKLVNDNLGHAAGDSLLIKVSDIIRSSFGKDDVAVRLGGDEFGVLMQKSYEDTVLEAYRRIKAHVRDNNEKDCELPVSVSIGWAIGNLTDRNDINGIVKEADRRMYAVKQINHLKYERLFFERFGMQIDNNRGR